MRIGLFKSLKILKFTYRQVHSISVKKPPWKVLFFGADEFSIYSLKLLCNEYKTGTLLKNLEVVTTTKGKPNPVKRYAQEHKLLLHSWPIEITDGAFDVGLVVSFGHLIPERIINKFPLAMLNVHASLLPRWRGAAPIIYALANGDTKTGITIMRIRPKYFDIGEMLMQAQVPINNEIKMPELHQQLGQLGARCLIDCLRNLPEKLASAKPQSDKGLTLAPKVTPEFAVIKWDKMISTEIYNRERALTSVYPLTSCWNGVQVKLAGITDLGNCDLFLNNNDSITLKLGFVKYDKKSKLLIVICANRTCISVEKVGVFGRKLMKAVDFNNGFIKKESLENRYFKFQGRTT